jgi:2-polyprenyl-3-methyl-5-hydroxy-6-metoxy-1,4-benzoquinol methylase
MLTGMVLVQPLSAASRRLKLRHFMHHLRPGDRVLEAGSGDGWCTRALKADGIRCISLDIAEKADVRGDIRQWRTLGLEPDSFDAILAFELIEHVDCIEDLRALLKPGGLLMLTTPVPAADPLLKILEAMRLTQPRITPHLHLRDISALPGMTCVSYRRVWGLAQWAVHRKD